MLDEVKDAPLFPIEQFADFLVSIVQHFGEEPIFRSLAERADEYVAKRGGAAAAGEKCMARAIEFLERGRLIAAINELHKAKMRWFSGEFVKGMLNCCLLLSTCYRELGLAYAAKYYSLATAFISKHDRGDTLGSFLPEALLEVHDCEEIAGCHFGSMQLLLLAIAAHVRFDQNPLVETEHPEIMEQIGQTVARIGFIRRGDAALAATVKSAMELWPKDMRDQLVAGAHDKSGFWMKGDYADVARKLQESVIDRPFGDLGPRRDVRWCALGIVWHCVFDNNFETTLIAEQFIAQIQLAVCTLAGKDIGLVPAKVVIEIDSKFKKKNLHKEIASKWLGSIFRVRLPKTSRQVR